MELDIEFLLKFNEEIVTEFRNKNLGSIFAVPVKVAKGQEIARVLEAGSAHKDGKKGIRYIVPKGVEVKSLLSGKLLHHEEKSSILSAIDGFLCARGGKLDITPHMEIEGDVGRDTGNLSSESTIIIKGGVAYDYKVESGADIEVFELVEGARLQAKGNVSLRGGVTGENKALITAGKNINVSFAQHCHMEAMGSIIVDGSLIDCDLSAGDKVVVSGVSALVGGVTRSRNGISVSKIGSEGGAATEVVIGYNPFYKIRHAEFERYCKEIAKKLAKAEKDAQFAARGLSLIIQYNPDDPMSCLMSMSDIARTKEDLQLDKSKKESYRRLGAALLSTVYLREVVRELESGERKAPDDKGNAKACLKVGRIAHPGVKISILDYSTTIDREYEMVKFVIQKDRICAVNL